MSESQGTPNPNVPKVEVREITAEMQTLIPKFATSVTARITPEYICLDFFFGDEPTVHLTRVVLSTDHAARLRDLLARQLEKIDVGTVKPPSTKKPPQKQSRSPSLVKARERNRSQERAQKGE